MKVVVGQEMLMANSKVIDWNVEMDKDFGSSFETPFGPYEEFPIPDIYISPNVTHLEWNWNEISLGIGFTINPAIGSQTIDANWSAHGDAAGGGIVTYHEPDVFYDFGPISANASEHTGYADIRLDDFKYYFDKFLLDVNANIIIEISGIPVLNIPIDLIIIDASNITGDSYLGVHSGTTASSASGNVSVISAVPPLPAPELPTIALIGFGMFSLLLISRRKQ